MSFDLTNKNIQDTFQNLLQKTGSDGHLYDLVGNKVRDLTIDGTLTANTYVTSQSITSTSSGSTAFGNSSDDTHKFTGNITASGNISASGDIIGGDIYLAENGEIYFGETTSKQSIKGGAGYLTIDADNAFTVQADNYGNITNKFGINQGTGEPPKTLTVGGDISASGTGHFSHLIVDRPFDSSDEEFFQIKRGGTTKFAVDEDGDITTYGRIIGGDGNPNQFDGTIGGHTGFTTNYINFNSNPMKFYTGGNIVLETTSTTAKFNYPLTVNNLTASLNISSSGNISAFTGTGSFGAVHTTGNISSSGIVNANSVQVNGTSVIETLVASDTQGRLTKTAGATASPIQLTNLGTTGNPTFNHITASGDISSSGTMYGKQIHWMHHAYLEDSDDGENFIPMAGTLIEVGTAQYYSKKIAPYDGEILKVLVNCENDPGDTLVRFYRGGSAKAQQNIADASIGTDTVIFDDINTAPGFAGADRTFSQGDVLSVSINPANAPGEVQVTTVWSYTVGP